MDTKVQSYRIFQEKNEKNENIFLIVSNDRPISLIIYILTYMNRKTILLRQSLIHLFYLEISNSFLLICSSVLTPLETRQHLPMADFNLLENLNPHVSVDCVVFGFENGKLNVLLIERNMEFEGKFYTDLKLPGDLVRMDENLDTAASRVLSELTGLDKIYLKQFLAIGSPERLLRRPRDMEWLRSIGHPEEIVVTIAYYSLINIDQEKASKFALQANACWHEVSSLKDLAFDHLTILHQALEVLRSDVKLKPIAFELLPPKFTLRQLQELYEAILGKGLDKRNFRKKMANMPFITSINEKQVDVSHKPAQFYAFSRKIYQKTKKENF